MRGRAHGIQISTQLRRTALVGLTRSGMRTLDGTDAAVLHLFAPAQFPDLSPAPDNAVLCRVKTSTEARFLGLGMLAVQEGAFT